MNCKMISCIGLLAICCLLVSGCKKETQPKDADNAAEQTKSLSGALEAQKSTAEKAVEEKSQEVTTKAQEAAKEATTQAQEIATAVQAMKPEDMNATQLREKALKYQNEISAKKADLIDLNEQLDSISADEAAGEKAKNIQNQIDSTNKDIKSLTDQFNIYYSLLKEKKGDLSGLGL